MYLEAKENIIYIVKDKALFCVLLSSKAYPITVTIVYVEGFISTIVQIQAIICFFWVFTKHWVSLWFCPHLDQIRRIEDMLFW